MDTVDEFKQVLNNLDPRYLKELMDKTLQDLGDTLDIDSFKEFFNKLDPNFVKKYIRSAFDELHPDKIKDFVLEFLAGSEHVQGYMDKLNFGTLDKLAGNALQLLAGDIGTMWEELFAELGLDALLDFSNQLLEELDSTDLKKLLKQITENLDNGTLVGILSRTLDRLDSDYIPDAFMAAIDTTVANSSLGDLTSDLIDSINNNRLAADRVAQVFRENMDSFNDESLRDLLKTNFGHLLADLDDRLVADPDDLPFDPISLSQLFDNIEAAAEADEEAVKASMNGLLVGIFNQFTDREDAQRFFIEALRKILPQANETIPEMRWTSRSEHLDGSGQAADDGLDTRDCEREEVPPCQHPAGGSSALQW